MSHLNHETRSGRGGDGPIIARYGVFGGVYNNHLALQQTIQDAQAQGAQALFCLGDVGGFGPHPDRSVEVLRSTPNLLTIQGNYDHSIGNDLDDCACGYTDPRDNAYAQISYDYTRAHTSDEHKAWLRALPGLHREVWGGARVLMAHGSPRQVNEFLWESTTSTPFLLWLLNRYEADVLFITHTGLPWQRRLPDGRLVVNVGAIGRPANRATNQVTYCMTQVHERGLSVCWRDVSYDHLRLAEEMRQEQLPQEFIETILTGWWTTCLEILPAKERASGRY